MNRILILAVVFLSILQLSLPARERSEPVRSPYEILLEAETFSIGPVGIAGIPSRQETAFREILKEKNANEQFRTLVTKATPAGQLYALLGLKLLHNPTYPDVAMRLGSSSIEITMFAGCVGARSTSAAIARKIENGSLK